jgi:hypothetical protein
MSSSNNNPVKINCIGEDGNSVFKVDTVSGIESSLNLNLTDNSVTLGNLVINSEMYYKDGTDNLQQLVPIESDWIRDGNNISYILGEVSVGTLGVTNVSAGNISAGNISFSGQLLQNGVPFVSGGGGGGSNWTKTGDDISYTDGNVGIGTTSPTQILQVGNAGRLRIANSNSDYTLLGTNDTDGISNTRIVLSGINRSGFQGNIDYTIPGASGSHLFYTQNLERMRIASSGRVGIGTLSPSAVLHISEPIGTVHGANIGSIIIDHENNGGASSIVFRSKTNRGSDYGYIQYQDAQTVGAVGETARLIIGIENDADDHLILSPSGNVGIGTNTPSQKLHVAGQILADDDITAFSDARLKSDIITIDSALDKVCSLRGVYYTHVGSRRRGTGVIAQEVQTVLPEVVHQSGEYLSVAYGNIIGVLIESIKELTARVESLEKYIDL